jgi:hypothetical protein
VVAGATSEPPDTPTPVKTVLGTTEQKPPGRVLPFTGSDGPLPGDDLDWILAVAALGFGIVLAVGLRRLAGRDD